MHKLRSRGFTLIELLVVIAIIGILSAVVLASLSTARNKGQFAALQSDLNTIQTQAEIYYNSNGNSYGTLASTTGASCESGGMFGDPTIVNAVKGVLSNIQGGTLNCGIYNSGQGYSVYVSGGSLPSGACINSAGYSGTTTPC